MYSIISPTIKDYKQHEHIFIYNVLITLLAQLMVIRYMPSYKCIFCLYFIYVIVILLVYSCEYMFLLLLDAGVCICI